jgi:hypothetical protein
MRKRGHRPTRSQIQKCGRLVAAGNGTFAILENAIVGGGARPRTGREERFVAIGIAGQRRPAEKRHPAQQRRQVRAEGRPTAAQRQRDSSRWDERYVRKGRGGPPAPQRS